MTALDDKSIVKEYFNATGFDRWRRIYGDGESFITISKRDRLFLEKKGRLALVRLILLSLSTLQCQHQNLNSILSDFWRDY